MIHWSWYLFVGIVALFIFFAWRINVNSNKPKGDYAFDILPLIYGIVWLAALLIFVAVFGGIFWW